MKKEIIIGCDHAGLKLKNDIIEYLSNKNYKVNDIGCYTSDAVDYPLIAQKVASEISQSNFEKGILICGTGIGMSIAANKVKGVRAVVCSDTTSAKFSRQHNNANILCIGERIVGKYLALDIVDAWLNTDFEAERHLRRVNLIE